jgi:Zn finger protein HypA/HybF involved in hydrogenase expression
MDEDEQYVDEYESEYSSRTYNDREEYTVKCPRCGGEGARLTIDTETHYFACGCCSESRDEYFVACDTCGEYEPEYNEREAIDY